MNKLRRSTIEKLISGLEPIMEQIADLVKEERESLEPGKREKKSEAAASDLEEAWGAIEGAIASLNAAIGRRKKERRVIGILPDGTDAVIIE